MKKNIFKITFFILVCCSIFISKKADAKIVGSETDKVTVGLYTQLISGEKLIIVNPNNSFRNQLYKTDLQNFFDQNSITVSPIKSKSGTVKSDSTNLETGDIITNSDNKKYTIVIYGDSDGDGNVCFATDVRSIVEDYVYNKKLTGIYKIATDLDRDSQINAIDVSRMVRKYIGTLNESLVKEMPSEDSTGSSESDNSSENSTESTPSGTYSISVKIKSSTLMVGETTKITTTISPSTANQSVTYTPESSGIVTVDSNGKVTAIGEGSTKIKVKSTTIDGLEGSVKVTVSKNVIHVENMTIEIDNKNIKVGDTAQITTTITPSNATDKGVTYTSSNTSVATVDQNGKVTGKSDGTATITVKLNDGGNTAKVTVNVTSKIIIEEINAIWISRVQQGYTVRETVTITPTNATNQTLKWTSSNTSVATVDQNGNVTGIKSGTATIKAETTDGSNLSVEKEITVY